MGLAICMAKKMAKNYIHVHDVNLHRSVQKLSVRKQYIFQQDDARPCMAKITKAWLCMKRVPVL